MTPKDSIHPYGGTEYIIYAFEDEDHDPSNGYISKEEIMGSRKIIWSDEPEIEESWEEN
ncbi:MAG: hypothetical protein HC831_02180 [Chloroflexia bacterium]|nr:hypothetical protein [Chloroflexia bacterium]